MININDSSSALPSALDDRSPAAASPADPRYAAKATEAAVKFEAFFPQPAIERECLVYSVRENRWMWQKRWNRPTQLARE